MGMTIEQAIAESIRAEKAAGNLYQGLVHKFSA
jgi:rubrerythrin